jgi:hypothetical protein
MKRCPYCGTEYPDDATACAIDQTPFGETSPEPAASIKLPRFGIFSERKIPVSLTLVSYLFFLTGAGLFAAVGFLAFGIVLLGGGFASSHIFISCFIGGVISLLVVLCLLIFPVTMLVTYAIFATCFVNWASLTGESSAAILGRLAGGAIAILFVYISRGLRMGSRRWRTCALAFILLEFVIMAFSMIQYFLTQGHHQHQWATKDWLECAFAVIVLAWQYRVLTRPDVRDLFYEDPPPSS